MDQNAGAVLNLPPDSTISVKYDSEYGAHDDLLLLEVDPGLLPEFLRNGVTIRGQPDEEAVLCTPSTTFALKIVSNSNSLLLIPSTSTAAAAAASPSSTSSASVLKIAPGNFELARIAPKLDKLKTLLAKRPYKPDEVEGASRSDLYTWCDLTNSLQASDNELRDRLHALSAIEIDGFWRLLHEESIAEFLAALLRNSVLFGWSFKELKEEEVIEVMEACGFCRMIVVHILGMFASELVGVWSLDERRLCLHFARRVLKKGMIRIEEFMEEWEQSVPLGMRPQFEMLEGEVLVDRLGVESWIRAFSVSSLPSSPEERFATLFRERPRWEGKDLEPFIRDLQVPGLSSEGLLIKYTRRTQPTADAEPVFSAR